MRPSTAICVSEIQELTVEFPTLRNREFSNAYQGMFFEEQGILIARAAKPGPNLKHWPVAAAIKCTL